MTSRRDPELPSRLEGNSPLNPTQLTQLTVNPFSKRESHSPSSILAYKILTILSWLLVTAATVYDTFHDGRKHKRHTIWGQNKPTPFALNVIITSIYW
jgi:hypothetical protein